MTRLLYDVAGARRLFTILSLGALVALPAAANGASAEGGSASVQGTVQSIGGRSLVLESRVPETSELGITGDTQFLKGGKQISSDEILPGDEVRASLRAENGALVATVVHLVRKGGTQPGGEEARPGVELGPPPGRHVPGGR